jgi:hypothetical protein
MNHIGHKRKGFAQHIGMKRVGGAVRHIGMKLGNHAISQVTGFPQPVVKTMEKRIVNTMAGKFK